MKHSGGSLALKASYDRIYAKSGLHADDPKFYRWIIQILGMNQGGSLLDVACGEGWVIFEAHQRGLRAYGLDISEEALRKAYAYTESESFVAGDSENLPFFSESFDCVTCLGSLENMLNPWKALSEIIRVTKPNGRICVQMPNIYWLGEIIETLYRKADPPPFQQVERSASRNAWRTFLLEAGLQVEKELRYNRRPLLFHKGKLKSMRKFIVRFALNLVTPFNLSWSLVYVCRKAPTPPGGCPDYYTLWEARQLQVVRGRTQP